MQEHYIFLTEAKVENPNWGQINYSDIWNLAMICFIFPGCLMTSTLKLFFSDIHLVMKDLCYEMIIYMECKNDQYIWDSDQRSDSNRHPLTSLS
jgi:hypothetical protein